MFDLFIQINSKNELTAVTTNGVINVIPSNMVHGIVVTFTTNNAIITHRSSNCDLASRKRLSSSDLRLTLS